MLRKLMFIMVAIAAVGTAALTPTPASAWHGGWHGGGWHGGGWHGGWRGGGWGYGRGWCYYHPYRCR
jgi:hypothetical protein